MGIQKYAHFVLQHSTTSLRFHRSRQSLRQFENNVTKDDFIQDKTRLLKNKQSNNKMDPDTDRWFNTGSWELALYRGNVVCLKKIFKDNINLNRAVRKELKMVSLLF